MRPLPKVFPYERHSFVTIFFTHNKFRTILYNLFQKANGFSECAYTKQYKQKSYLTESLFAKRNLPLNLANKTKVFSSDYISQTVAKIIVLLSICRLHSHCQAGQPIS